MSTGLIESPVRPGATTNSESLAKRASGLGAHNGMAYVLVTLTPPVNPTSANLEVHFFNKNGLADLVTHVAANVVPPAQLFPITGGHRLRAGRAAGQVQVTSVVAGPTADSLLLTVAPIGDYSTYTLGAFIYQAGPPPRPDLDPVFSELQFKFRPGCFTTDCAGAGNFMPAPVNPAIDYLARDYDSFRHNLIAAMGQWVPGWRATTEADLDQTLIDLFSAAADELSDYQDRMMNEAYLGTARKRVSLARHARLMDYHIHQGNQATSWLALQLGPVVGNVLPAGFKVWTGVDDLLPTSQVFVTRDPVRLDPLLSSMELYTWGDTIPALACGSTEADLRVTGLQADAITVRDLIRSGAVAHLLIQERLNPATGNVGGRDPLKRQLLQLLPGNEGAEAVQDTVVGDWMVRVRWRDQDALQKTYCFSITCPAPVGKVTDVSFFCGNLVKVYHGVLREAHFHEPGTLLLAGRQYFYERTDGGSQRWGTICRLPDTMLAYLQTPTGGEFEPQTTLEPAPKPALPPADFARPAVTVELPDGTLERWDERIDLIHSDDSNTNGQHYLVETDEMGQSLIRFGNRVNGQQLPDLAVVHCRYQVGYGPDGNIGPDTLVNFDSKFNVLVQGAEVWNPFDGVNGLPPEPAAEIVRRVPEAYRQRQRRAVTLADYVRRAEEVDGVSRAAARYAWTGSWRTVQVTIDPKGTTLLNADLIQRVENHLNSVRLIGEDLELRPPEFVPLDIRLSLCINPAYWIGDVQAVLLQELSDGYTPDGRQGFFHPDLWTFGQPLHASQIIGRVQAVEGVEHVISITLKRWDSAAAPSDTVVDLKPNELILVQNDPDHMELGFITLNVEGGRQ